MEEKFLNNRNQGKKQEESGRKQKVKKVDKFYKRG